MYFGVLIGSFAGLTSFSGFGGYDSCSCTALVALLALAALKALVTGRALAAYLTLVLSFSFVLLGCGLSCYGF